jgi:hypothetical protein
MEVILKSAASAIIAYTAHYASTKFYSYACVPDGWMGYLNGLITTGSPVCQVGVQLISSTQTSYSSMLLMSISRILVDLVAPGASPSK